VEKRRFIGDVYRTYADEFQEVVRVRGFECFIPAPLPEGVPRDKPNVCQRDGDETASRYGLTAARGYALFERDSQFGPPVWIGHWWTVTENDEVVDASWEMPGLAYFGERIGVRELDDNGRRALAAYTFGGELITDLGVFVYPPPAVMREIEHMRSALRDGS
jgi:hypothetical protein